MTNVGVNVIVIRIVLFFRIFSSHDDAPSETEKSKFLKYNINLKKYNIRMMHITYMIMNRRPMIW